MAMHQQIPSSVQEFEKQFPEVWQAFVTLGTACHESGGPLDEKTRRLVKLGIAVC
jgi:alkylhydroperoxidase/carboxymuconolactone decarboxylase family protein YurZ